MRAVEAKLFVGIHVVKSSFWRQSWSNDWAFRDSFDDDNWVSKSVLFYPILVGNRKWFQLECIHNEHCFFFLAFVHLLVGIQHSVFMCSPKVFCYFGNWLWSWDGDNLVFVVRFIDCSVFKSFMIFVTAIIFILKRNNQTFSLSVSPFFYLLSVLLALVGTGKGAFACSPTCSMVSKNDVHEGHIL